MSTKCGMDLILRQERLREGNLPVKLSVRDPFMPHIHLETTADLEENSDVPDILDALVARLSALETVASENVKAYHTLRSNWKVGAGAPSGFAHCTVAILEGRPAELRRAIAEGMYEEMKAQFATSFEAGEAGLTLELREMAAETYMKSRKLP
jgi:5-carboxymethyl-2-hydroxymuconate isomerase